jgi:hypothetical protein
MLGSGLAGRQGFQKGLHRFLLIFSTSLIGVIRDLGGFPEIS